MELKRKSDNQYELTGLDVESGACWIVVGKAHIGISKTDEGVVVDIYRKEDVNRESVASCYAFDNELGEDDGDA